MAYLFMHEPKGAYRKFSGHVTHAEFIQSLADVHNDPDFDRMRYSISDFLDVQSHDVDTKTVTLASAYGIGAAFTNPGMKLAFVAVESQVLELISLYAMRIPYQAKVFSHIDDARAWIAGSD